MALWKPAASKRENSGLKLPNLGKQQWIVLLLMGLLLAVAMLPVSGKGKMREEKTEGRGWNTSVPDTDTADKSQLEEKLEAILSSVEGVGEVQVMLMTAEENTGGFSGSGVQKVTGALIAAEGAGHSETIQKIQEAVMALFQVEAHKIKVMKMK